MGSEEQARRARPQVHRALTASCGCSSTSRGSDARQARLAHRAADVAIVGPGRLGAGGSQVLTMRWVHDLLAFNRLSVEEQQRVIGRTKSDTSTGSISWPSVDVLAEDVAPACVHEHRGEPAHAPWLRAAGSCRSPCMDRRGVEDRRVQVGELIEEPHDEVRGDQHDVDDRKSPRGYAVGEWERGLASSVGVRGEHGPIGRPAEP